MSICRYVIHHCHGKGKIRIDSYESAHNKNPGYYIQRNTIFTITTRLINILNETQFLFYIKKQIKQ